MRLPRFCHQVVLTREELLFIALTSMRNQDQLLLFQQCDISQNGKSRGSSQYQRLRVDAISMDNFFTTSIIQQLPLKYTKI